MIMSFKIPGYSVGDTILRFLQKVQKAEFIDNMLGNYHSKWFFHRVIKVCPHFGTKDLTIPPALSPIYLG